MDYVHFHAHTTYSILDAWGTPDQIAERLEAVGARAHAITDHDSISGHWKMNKALTKIGVKPIFGIEIRVLDSLEQKTWRSPEGRRFYPYHLTLVAGTEEGYRNLVQLTSLAWRQGMGGRGMYMPVITWTDLTQYQKGLIGLSGCLNGKLSRAILGEVDTPWKQVLKEMEACFEPGNFYVEWQNINLDACRVVANKLASHPQAIMTHDVHFPTQDKQSTQNIMAAIRRWKKVTGPEAQGPMEPQCFLADDREAWEIQKEFGSVGPKLTTLSMDRASMLAATIDVTLPQIGKPKFVFPQGYTGTTVEYFRELIREGWKKRGLHKLPTAERLVYKERVKHEYDLIVDKDFVDYFLIVADICKFCVREDILKGPARGSSAGSLIAWLLEITEVDPLHHGLIFERFIGVERKDLPDIDMDFPDDRREEIHEYLTDKYGRDRIGYIGTFTTFKAKNSLDDVARVFELPTWVPGKIKPYIPERAHGDVRANMTLADSMGEFEEVMEVAEQFPEIMHAVDLEGQFRAMGVHPAGFVVSSEPIEDVVPIYEQPEKGRVVGVDMYDAADAGLLKLDLLGLSTMTVLQRARDAVRERHGVDIDFYTLSLDDEDTLQGFRDVDVLGIFQFQGKATKNTLRQIKVSKFSQLADINTLSRPGAMLAGTSDEYVKIHNKIAPPQTVHPIIDKICEETHGLVIYQEQVLRIMKEFGDLTWAQAGEIRKDISKRMGMESLQRFRQDFVEGAARLGIDEETAVEVWMKTSTFGAYGFNKSHSVSYAMIAYWQMFIKRHYPTEFYYASLAVESDVEKRDLFIGEAKRKGVEFLPVDPNRSDLVFALEQDGIRYGLTQVHGIGLKTAELIMEARPIKGRADLLAIKGIGEKTASLFDEALEKGDDLFGLVEEARKLQVMRKKQSCWGVLDLRQFADTKNIDTHREIVVAAHIVSRNYRQEQKLSVQAKDASQVGAKSETVIVYIRDDSGESMPVVVPGRVATKKVREIWEGEKHDIYLLRGTMPKHGKFFLCTGLANSSYQDRRSSNDAVKKAPTQLELW